MLSQDQKNKDKQEVLKARKEAMELLKDIEPIINSAVKKLKYNKSDSIIFQLKQSLSDIKESIELLKDRDL